ncbi:MAG: hypothetical protein AB8B56_13300 [Crocinitomicaceae bacterium]
MENFFKHKMRGKSPAMIAGMVVLGIIAISGLAILFGFTVMWLWNWLMPELFGLPTLTFWKAVGVVILSKLLFGGFGGKGGSGKHHSSSKKSKKNNDFSKWSHYDKFWEEEGEKAYAEYCEKINNPEEEVKEKEESDNAGTLNIEDDGGTDS